MIGTSACTIYNAQRQKVIGMKMRVQQAHCFHNEFAHAKDKVLDVKIQALQMEGYSNVRIRYKKQLLQRVDLKATMHVTLSHLILKKFFMLQM